MKSPHMTGKGLAFCLSAMLALAPIQNQSAHRVRPSSPPMESVAVWHREGSRYRFAAELSAVSYVRAILEPPLRKAVLGLSNAERARRVLSERFGTRMTETASPAQYMWVLVEGRWVLVCFSVTEFEIDFGRWGHVVVRTEDSMET